MLLNFEAWCDLGLGDLNYKLGIALENGVAKEVEIPGQHNGDKVISEDDSHGCLI